MSLNILGKIEWWTLRQTNSLTHFPGLFVDKYIFYTIWCIFLKIQKKKLTQNTNNKKDQGNFLAVCIFCEKLCSLKQEFEVSINVGILLMKGDLQSFP